MELMLLVYLVSVVGSLPALIAAVLVCWAIFTVFYAAYAHESYTRDSVLEERKLVLKSLFKWKTALALLVVAFTTPDETTMKYMAGAYLVQSAYESDLMQEATPLAKRAVLNQLKSWAKDAPDLLDLLPQENEDVTTNQP